MKEAKVFKKKEFAKSLVKLSGGILAAGTLLTILTAKVYEQIKKEEEK